MSASHDRVVLGPLTTQWAWSSTCDFVALRTNSNNGGTGWLAQTCINGLPQDAIDCWPPRTSGVSTRIPVQAWGLYSPGISCPVGFTSACSSTVGVPGGFGFEFPLLEGETAVGCCLTSYACQDGGGTRDQTCVSVATSVPVAAASCRAQTFVIFSQTAPANSISTINVYAPMIMIAWQSTDRAATATAGLNGTAAATAVSSHSSDSSISSAAIVGISVACTAVGITLLAVIVWLFVTRRRERRNAAFQLPGQSRSQKGPSEATELPVTRATSEAPGDTHPYFHRPELEGSAPIPVSPAKNAMV